MTAQKTKPTQKRLNNCVLSPLRWAKIYEKLENCACGTLKIKDAVANAAVRVANAPKKGQARRNTTLLGKYTLILLPCLLDHDIGHHGHVIADRLMHRVIEHMDGFDLAAVD